MPSIKNYIKCYLILITTCIACNQDAKEKDNVNDSTLTKKSNNKVDSLKKNEVSAIVKLPFGSELLVSNKFPKTWDVALNDDGSKQAGPYDKSINKIFDFYIKLNAKPSYTGPDINNFTITKLGLDSIIKEDARKFKTNFKCQLPDIGTYQCYYTYDENSANNNNINLGSLVIYNKTSKHADILNIYSAISYDEDAGATYRFFNINSDGTGNIILKIFEYEAQESDSTLQQTNEVTIFRNGKIVVKDIK